jgi:hypothetical protein
MESVDRRMPVTWNDERHSAAGRDPIFALPPSAMTYLAQRQSSLTRLTIFDPVAR